MSSEPNATAQTILIAEDEALVLKMLTYRLQKEGYTVLTAADGRQALSCLGTTIPDLVITDLMMPYHGGLDIVRYIRDCISRPVPIIVLSASGQETVIQEALRLGADAYVDKPFSPNELVRHVKEYLS